jgi:hypothetical protein
VPLTASIACEFGAADGVAEAIWVQQCADRVRVPNAFIAAVQLDSADLPDVLARYRDLPMVRAVRQPLYWPADPNKRLVRAATTFAPQPGCADLSRSPTRGWYGICLYSTNSYPRLTISSRIDAMKGRGLPLLVGPRRMLGVSYPTRCRRPRCERV